MRQIIPFGLFCICLGFGETAERFRRGYHGYHRPRHYDEIGSDYDYGGGGANGDGGGGYSGSKGGHSDLEGGYSGGGGGYSAVEAGFSGGGKEHSAVWGRYSGGDGRQSGGRGEYSRDESVYGSVGGGNGGNEGGNSGNREGDVDVEGGYGGRGRGYDVVRGGYSSGGKEHSGVWGGYSGVKRGPSGGRDVYSRDESIYSSAGGGNGGSEGGSSGNRGGQNDAEGRYSGGGRGYSVVRGGYNGDGKELSPVWGGYSGFERAPSGRRGVFGNDGSMYSGVGIRNSGGRGEHSISGRENNDKGRYDDKSGNEKYGSGGEKGENGSFRDYLKSVHDAAQELKELILRYLSDQEKAAGKEKEIETNSDDESSGFTTTESINGDSGGNANEVGLSLGKNGGVFINMVKRDPDVGLSDSHQSGVSNVKVVEITTDSTHDISKGHEGDGSQVEKGKHEDSVFSERNGRHSGLKDYKQIKHQTGGFKGVFSDKSEGKNLFNGGVRFASDNHVKVVRGKGEVDAGITFGYGGESTDRVGDKKDVGSKGVKPVIYCGEMGCNGLERDEETVLEKKMETEAETPATTIEIIHG